MRQLGKQVVAGSFPAGFAGAGTYKFILLMVASAYMMVPVQLAGQPIGVDRDRDAVVATASTTVMNQQVANKVSGLVIARRPLLEALQQSRQELRALKVKIKAKTDQIYRLGWEIEEAAEQGRDQRTLALLREQKSRTKSQLVASLERRADLVHLNQKYRQQIKKITDTIRNLKSGRTGKPS
jgi:hypothetical protein